MSKTGGRFRTQYHPVDHVDEHVHAMSRYKPYRYRPIFIKSLCYASVAVVPLIFATWLPLGWEKLRHVDIFEGSPLGGTLTLTQAKAIDFVSSAILAPLLFGGLNYVWFSVARVSIINERKPNAAGTSLHALLEASSTAAGTYDFFKFWTLFTSRSSRLMVFAFITITAAFAKSLLSNIIAYEAFNEARDATDVSLRMLNGFHMTGDGVVQDGNTTSKDGSTIYLPTSNDQQKQFTMQTTSVMQQAVWQNSTTYMNGSAYIAVNVTQQDLAKVPSIDMVLYDVPAVKGVIDCKPYSPADMRYVIPARNAGYSGTVMNIYFYDTIVNENTSLSDAKYALSIPSDTSALDDGSSASYTRSTDFLAYDQHNTTSMFIGSMAQNIGLTAEWIKNNSDPIQTHYGTMQSLASNFTTNGNGSCDNVAGTPCQFLVWGLACSITQQQGLLTLSRSTANAPWAFSQARWDDSTKIIRPSNLAAQSRTLGKIQYQSMKYGVGPALTPTARTCTQKGDGSEGCTPYGPENFNYETLSHNLLWAEMEIQRIAYEVGAMNSSLADSTTRLYRTVTALGDVQFYRITYVPALLFGALLFMFLTASLTAFLSVYSRRTISHQNFRVYDSLRLLMDCVASPGFAKVMRSEDAIVAPNHVLEEWAKEFKVKHEAYRTEKDELGTRGTAGVVIVPVSVVEER